MNIDFKVTGWDRATFYPTQAQLHELQKALENEEIISANDLIDFAEERGIEIEWEYLVNTQEQLYPTENGGQATIEAFIVDADKKEHKIYHNAEEQWTQEKS